MRAHGRRLFAELAKFLTVGGLATVVSFTLFNLLAHGLGVEGLAVLREQPIVAYVIANGIGMAVSYRGSRRWTWRERPPAHRDGGRTAFVGINVATMGLPVLCLAISRNVLGLDDPISDNIAANVVGLGMGTATRFYLFRRFIFRRGAVVAPPHDLTGATGRSSGDPAVPPGRAGRAG
jgi:putative flippase GtrA